MRRQLLPALMMMIVMTVLTGLVYTLAFTGFAQLVFPGKADGSRVQVHGKDVGSEYIGQAWVDQKGKPLRQYFQSRPSAATGAKGTTAAGYDPTLSLGSNYGPTNHKFLRVVARRVKDYRRLNGLTDDAAVPVDAVTASASGLDPNISIANARLQATRVARARGLSRARVTKLIDDDTDGRTLGVLGEKRVNVLLLNLALDRVAPTTP